ncbi:MAG: ABC transporter ATP-binding protein [Spartobacteria bacterium]|nr:ABC transporter ATP-binding protein [Spartobacteria bacterium]
MLNDPQPPDKPVPFRVFGQLLKYALPYRGWMALVLVMILLMTLLFNYLPILLRNAIDHWIDNQELPAQERITGLLHVGLTFIALTVFAAAIRYGQGLLATWTGQRIVRNIRRDVFEKALRLSRNYFDTTPVGHIMTRVTSDVDVIQHFVSAGIAGSVADIFMFAGVITFMCYLSPLLSLALLGVIPFMAALFLYSNLKLRRANRAIRKNQSALNANVQEALSGMTTIQLFNREHTAREIFNEHNMNLRGACFNEVRWFSFYFPVIDLSQAMATVLILGIGGSFILRGTHHVTLGVLIAFLSYIGEFFRPIDSLSNKAGLLQQALASCERIFALLNEPETVRDPETPVTCERVTGEITFDHVWFAYDEENWILKDINLSIRPGESVAIVGATGSGKTTLINLLCRFYDVQKGSIRIDGHDVRAFRQHELHRHVGMVLQDPFIFSGSVAENISLCNPDISLESIQEMAICANADAFIRKLPMGYDTPLNERGAGLSTGQKQLLALARVLTVNREALLILDEATANIDSETERLIQEALDRVMKDRTSIIIAHRLSTIKHVDRILVMHQGRIVAQGNHEALIRQDGYYRRLYEYLAASTAPP